MNVERISDVDICRDGGSYSLCFDAEDGHWYEFFLKTRAFDEDRSRTHHPPVIYLDGYNDGVEVARLTWEDAKSFVAPLRYESRRFSELVHIVMNEGRADAPNDDAPPT